MGKKAKMRRKIVDDESVLNNTAEDDRPETSPYVTATITLSIGLSAKRYTVLQEFLEQCPLLKSKLQFGYIKLPELDNDIGHTLVHFLYTGTYQTLKLRGVAENVEITEYKRSVLVYSAARTYELSGLEMLAKTHMEIFEKRISIFDFLDIARELYPKFPEDDIWFFDYFKKKIKTAYEADETLFSKELFLDRFGTVMEFDKSLVKTIVDIYNEKIVGLTRMGDSACEEAAPCDEDSPPYEEATPCEEAAPWDEGPPPCEEAAPWDEAPPCEEAAPCDEAPPCEEAAPCDEAPPCEEAAPCDEDPPPCEEAAPCEAKAEPPPPCEEPAPYGQYMESLVRAIDSKKGKGRKKKKAQYGRDTEPLPSDEPKLEPDDPTPPIFSFKSEDVLKDELALEREPEYAIETEPAHELTVEENGLCVSRATHLFHGEMWPGFHTSSVPSPC